MHIDFLSLSLNLHNPLLFSGAVSCKAEPDLASRFWDELSYVGLPKDLEVQSLFESGRTDFWVVFDRKKNPQILFFLFFFFFLLNAKSVYICGFHQNQYVLKFQGNVGHMRVVPCGLTVFVRVRDNLCLMWTEPLTQGAQRWVAHYQDLQVIRCC